MNLTEKNNSYSQLKNVKKEEHSVIDQAKEVEATALQNNINMSDRKHIIFLVIVTLLCFLPFLNKAYFVDDPLFIWCAKQIQHHPLDPYGFNVNWYGIDAPMSNVMRNPPLTSYYIAVVGSIGGWSEVAVHTAFLLPAILCVVGMYFLSRQLCDDPLLATLINLCTPVFLVSSSTVMCDTMMLMFEVWAFVFWIRAHEEQKPYYGLISVFFLMACVLTKFTGLMFIPLLAVYSIVKLKKVLIFNLYLIIPAAMLFVYLAVYKSMYGDESLWNSLTYATTASGKKPMGFSTIVVGLSFVGGCFLPVLFYAPFLWKRKTVLIGTAILAIALLQVWIGELLSGVVLQKVSMDNPILAIQLLLFVVSSIILLLLTSRDSIKNKNAESIFLGLLVFGVIIFTVVLSWSISARYLLPMTPAIGILIVRNLDMSIKKSWLYCSLLLSAVIAIVTLTAEYSMANSERTAANEIVTKYKSQSAPLWFQGHWGFQYYMESLGAVSSDGQKPAMKPGDLLIFPNNNSTYPIDPKQVVIKEKMNFPVLPFVATMSPSVGAGFYAHVRGPLPYAFGEVAPELYYVLEIKGEQIVK